MQNGFRIFLLTVEEMSFSKAAARAFMTQQSVSDHIRRLEEVYGVRLFERRPRLTLTPAGEAMVQALWQVDIVERSMAKRLGEIASGLRGYLRMGLNSTRARILLPSLLWRYHEAFPEVTTSFVLDDTQNLENMLLKGELDVMIGVNMRNDPLYLKRRLTDDQAYLLIGEKMLSGHSFAKNIVAAEHSKEEVPLDWFTDIPFVRNLQDSTITSLVDRHASENNLTLHSAFSISDYDVQISLCGQNLAAMFCPSMILERVIEYNQRAKEDEQIHIFRVKGLKERLRVDLATHRNALLPLYMQTFLDLIEEEFVRYVKH